MVDVGIHFKPNLMLQLMDNYYTQTMVGALISQVGYHLVVLGITGLVGLAIYRLYLSPLAKFPGPKLAALSTAYEGFYDCLKDGGGGRYFEEVDRMHDEYGLLDFC